MNFMICDLEKSENIFAQFHLQWKNIFLRENWTWNILLEEVNIKFSKQNPITLLHNWLPPIQTTFVQFSFPMCLVLTLLQGVNTSEGF